jgi:hypothetical protein
MKFIRNSGWDSNVTGLDMSGKRQGARSGEFTN